MTARYWAVVLLTGAGAGVAGGLLTLLLHGVQHLAFGYTENTLPVRRPARVVRAARARLHHGRTGRRRRLVGPAPVDRREPVGVGGGMGQGRPDAAGPLTRRRRPADRDRRAGRIAGTRGRTAAGRSRVGLAALGVGGPLGRSAPAADGLRRGRRAGRGLQRSARGRRLHARSAAGDRPAWTPYCPLSIDLGDRHRRGAHDHRQLADVHDRRVARHVNPHRLRRRDRTGLRAGRRPVRPPHRRGPRSTSRRDGT